MSLKPAGIDSAAALHTELMCLLGRATAPATPLEILARVTRAGMIAPSWIARSINALLIAGLSSSALYPEKE